VRAKAEATAVERFVQRIDPWLEPGSFYGKAEVFDAQLE
jgi:hypothetical protein